MREFFKRSVDGSLVTIEVDLDADQYKKDNPWLFSIFIKYDGSDDTKDDYKYFLELKESLIIAIEHDENAHFLGSRVVDGWSELYFCASSSKELSSTASMILSPTNYVYESNAVKDAKWDFYELQLFPTELELHNIQSDKIIAMLKEEGDDIDVQREVEHYAVFDTPTQKERFIESALKAGFEFKDDIASDEYEHGVAVVKTHSVSEEKVKEIVEELFGLIKKEHGSYEGWSTTLANEEDE